MFCASGPGSPIARYLHGFLQSLYYVVARATTFTGGVDAVQAMETYAKNGLLQKNTLLATIEIKDLITVFSHEEVLKTLERFLCDHVSDQQTSGLSHTTIIALVRLVLRLQYFVYDDKLYRQTTGGGTGLPLIKLLAEIYLFYWQQDLIKFLSKRKEVYGR